MNIGNSANENKTFEFISINHIKSFITQYVFLIIFFIMKRNLIKRYDW